MKVIVVGLGVQGHKRRRFAGDDFVASVDPVNEDADHRAIEDVPLSDYDAAMLCVPDAAKGALLDYLLSNAKHVLVEKPLSAGSDEEITRLESLANRNGVVCYVAYNHRFEPHFARMRDLIASGELGELYRCRAFYGNGTARLVRDSAWRDKDAGVLPDLGSHLLDTMAFWFGPPGSDFRVASASCFENRAPDHVVLVSDSTRPKIELEMTLLSWRNHFTCDLLAEKGSAHIESLCKWGPTTFTKRIRLLPSGRPPEETVTLIRDDPTWALEYAHFKTICEEGRVTALSHDLWMHRVLGKLTEDVLRAAAR